MIHVLATIELNDGTREAFLGEFRRIVPLVRAEAGCIEYGGAVDCDSGLAVQGKQRDNVVLVIEKWESLEHLHAHLQAPHMVAYRGKIKDYVERVSLQVLEPV
jgi:quinol monooxygenase YgiN